MAVVVVGWILRGDERRSARKEVGSEIELAANRKPYYDDEVLEGRRLERVQLYGVLLLVVLVIGLPLYWVLEPIGRPAPRRASRAASSRGARSCSRPPPTVASTAPGATAG